MQKKKKLDIGDILQKLTNEEKLDDPYLEQHCERAPVNVGKGQVLYDVVMDPELSDALFKQWLETHGPVEDDDK